MATKDHSCSSFKGVNQTTFLNQNGHQYSNLNLNGNQKCSSILETFQSNKSISASSNFTSTQKKNNNDENIIQSKNCSFSWNKSRDNVGGGNIYSNDSNIFGSTEISKKSSSNNGTLSIHITAYENSIEAQNGLKSSSAKNDGTNLSKRKINKVFKVLKTGFASMDAFEIPRQQTSEGTNEPEIMGFKASQKLQNPNNNSIANNVESFNETEDSTSKMSITDKAEEEQIKYQISLSLKVAAVDRAAPHYQGAIFTYDELRDTILEDFDVDITAVANTAGYSSGVAYLRKLGFEFHGETDNLILPHVPGARATPNIHKQQKKTNYRAETTQRYRKPSAPPVNYKSQSVAAQSHEYTSVPGGDGKAVQPCPAPAIRIHIFDGDVSKLTPGMHVQIAGGAIKILPVIPEINFNEPRSAIIQRKAGERFRKIVRELVNLHNKMTTALDAVRPAYHKTEE